MEQGWGDYLFAERATGRRTVPSAGGRWARQRRSRLPDASRGENSHRWPMFLPDGKHFLYLAANVAGQEDPDAIFVGKLDSSGQN